MAQLYKGKPLRYWADKTGLPIWLIQTRIKIGMIDELILKKREPQIKSSSPDPEWVSHDFEAWEGLTEEQLETMRDFEQLGNIQENREKMRSDHG